MNLKSSRVGLRQERKHRREESLRRSKENLRKVFLLVVAEMDLTDLPWAKEGAGYARNLDLPRLYQWAERVSTEVWDSPELHFSANQLAALVLKAPFDWKELGFEMSPRERAIEKFNHAEERCRRTNLRFARLLHGRVENCPYVPLLERMRQFISRVLGESPDLEEIFEKCGYGPGANVGVHGNATNLFRKFFADDWTVTPTCLPYAIPAVMRNHHLFEALCEERNGLLCFDESRAVSEIRRRIRTVNGNLVSFVPKTAKTERSIAVEPLLNSYVQKGVDLVMRQRLALFGYNLSDQSRNAEMAREGSVSGRFGTLDLSSASDTVSTLLVKYLLPTDWFDLLNRTRSATYTTRGSSRPYEKFASMGNGFCFPLETLVFAAALRAVLADDRAHTVYGDDIVVPKDAFGPLIRLLRFCGFVPNPSKSFNEGEFRESCGADWYRGQDVRPVYLKEHLADVSAYMTFHNATLRSPIVARAFSKARAYLRELVPPDIRFLRPHGRGSVDFETTPLEVKNLNGAFTVAYDEFLGSRWARWHIDEQRWSWKEFVYRPVRDKHDPKGSVSSSSFRLAQYWSFLLGSPSGDLYLRRETKRSTRII
nr:MAG: RNA dependent RNA polymerase [Leviviridae sp.]